MPAGDLVVEAYQFEVRTTLLGPGSNYQLDYQAGSSWTPLGVTTTKTEDTELDHQAGSYGAADFNGPRVFSFPVFMEGTPDQVGGYLYALLGTIWAPCEDGVDIPLYTNVPGPGKFFVNGRPRVVTYDTKNLHFGHADALLQFVALDPTITEV